MAHLDLLRDEHGVGACGQGTLQRDVRRGAACFKHSNIQTFKHSTHRNSLTPNAPFQEREGAYTEIGILIFECSNRGMSRCLNAGPTREADDDTLSEYPNIQMFKCSDALKS